MVATRIIQAFAIVLVLGLPLRTIGSSGLPIPISFSVTAAYAAVQNDNSDDDNSDDDDNQNDNADDDNQNDNADDDNQNDNADENDNIELPPITIPPPPPPPAPAPPAAPGAPISPPAAPGDEIAQCLQNGQTLVYQTVNGGVAVKSFQNNLFIRLTKLDQSNAPPPPGAIVAQFIFRMSGSPCGGQPYTALPAEVNLGLTYSDQVAAGRNEANFVLMFYDGAQWTTAPKMVVDPANNHVSGSVTGLGVYALVQR